MRLLPVLLACCFTLAAAQGDPLKSPECGAAIAQLQAARAAQPGQVEAMRRAASAACFGTASPPSRPARVLQAPVRVPPPIIDAPPRAQLPRVPAPPPPPFAVGRPPTISSCDGTGCWVNDGSNRLQHVTPGLMAPSGLCGIAPGAAGCP